MPPPARDRESLWDIRAVARRLGVPVRHVRRLVAERRIPFIKWGHLLRFEPSEIEAWIDNARRSPEPGPASSRVPHVLTLERRRPD